MAAISSAAPGKIILFGEHAVVYGRRAIAIPVNQVQARAAVFPLIKDEPGTIRVVSAAIQLDADIQILPVDHPIRKAIQLTLHEMGIPRPPAMLIRISSTIPIAGGMGSGAAVSVAVARAVSTYIGRPLTKESISGVAYEVEKLYHGTPSGIDNTVIAYNSPVLFQKGKEIQTFQVGKRLTFLIADTGIRASTGNVINKVRNYWTDQPDQYENYFNQVDDLVGQALSSMKLGDEEFIGRWMTENHAILNQIGVSCPELNRLVDIACSFGVFGAKLSGAGMGGNMIALISPEQADALQEQMKEAGAVQTFITYLEGTA